VPRARHGAFWSSLVSVACLLRSFPRFLGAAPKTPLRVLGVVALDTVHVLRRGRPLPRQKIRAVALFLDFAGYMNAAWDRKPLCAAEYRAVRQSMEHAGLGSCMANYLGRWQAIERWRPAIGGDHRRFDEIRSYREAVAGLTLATAAAIALDDESLEDTDMATLFRILMQCQIIDDVLDYEADRSAGLPTFLTAAPTRPEAVALTADTSRHYAAQESSLHAALPLRLALWGASTLAQLAVRVADQPMIVRLAGICST
jgi:hypothetical protein